MIKYSRQIIFSSICFFFLLKGMAQDTNLYSKEYFVSKSGKLNYRMLLPPNFDKSKSYPLVLFLHGAGERGDDNEKQLVHGSTLFTSKANRTKFPAVVIFPQCPRNDFWAVTKIDRTTKPIKREFPINKPPNKPLKLVIELLNKISLESYIDKNKIYVGGLSMGGMGTFEILNRKPNVFAAAFPICGGGNPQGVLKYARHTALWVFHGAKDTVVNPQLSIDMVSAILRNGGNPSLSLYSNDNHNSWDSAFEEPHLMEWLFSNKRM